MRYLVFVYCLLFHLGISFFSFTMLKLEHLALFVNIIAIFFRRIKINILIFVHSKLWIIFFSWCAIFPIRYDINLINGNDSRKNNPIATFNIESLGLHFLHHLAFSFFACFVSAWHRKRPATMRTLCQWVNIMLFKFNCGKYKIQILIQTHNNQLSTDNN